MAALGKQIKVRVGLGYDMTPRTRVRYSKYTSAGRTSAGPGSGTVHIKQERSGAADPSPPQPGPNRPGSEGGAVRYGASTPVPSRPALVMHSGSCTEDCEYFRNKSLSDIICSILFDRAGLAAQHP